MTNRIIVVLAGKVDRTRFSRLSTHTQRIPVPGFVLLVTVPFVDKRRLYCGEWPKNGDGPAAPGIGTPQWRQAGKDAANGDAGNPVLQKVPNRRG